MSVVFFKWAYRRVEQFKRSWVIEAVRSSTHTSIAKSSRTIANAARVGATLANRMVKEDPSARYDALMKLKQLLDAGALTVDEYDVEKQKLLDR